MIEISRESVLQAFYEKADRFLADPSVLNGIEFDDAVVKLKRLLNTEQPDSPLVGRLNTFGPLIRGRDTDSLADHLAVMREQAPPSGQ